MHEVSIICCWKLSTSYKNIIFSIKSWINNFLFGPLQKSLDKIDLAKQLSILYRGCYGSYWESNFEKTNVKRKSYRIDEPILNFIMEDIKQMLREGSWNKARVEVYLRVALAGLCFYQFHLKFSRSISWWELTSYLNSLLL